MFLQYIMMNLRHSIVRLVFLWMMLVLGGRIYAQCPPNITVSSTPSTPVICTQGDSLTLTASGPDGTVYSWSPSAGIAPGTTRNASVRVKPSATTTYVVTAIAPGCSAIQSSIRVTVNTSPTLTITPVGETICTNGNCVVLTAAGAATYTWTPAHGLNVTTGNTVCAKPDSTTTYTVTGTTAGCPATRTVTITVLPAPNVRMLSRDTTICEGSTVQICATGAASYVWRPNIGLTSTTGACVQASPTASTTYTVTGVTNGCATTRTVTVNVISKPVLSITPVTTTICRGASAVISATGALSYRWTPTTGLAPGDSVRATINASPNVTTTYRLVGTRGNCSAEATVTVVVDQAPSLSLLPTSAAVCPGQCVTITASGASSYSWTPATGLGTTNTAAVVACPNVTTTYNVTGSSGGGCPAQGSITVTVNQPANITISPANPSICSGGSVVLNAAGASTYAWTGPNVTPTTGNSVIASPTSTTTYVVRGVTREGCVGSTTVTVTVGNTLDLTVTPPSGTICRGDTIHLSASGGESYLWLPNLDIDSANKATVKVFPRQSRTYTVRATSGNCVRELQVPITVVDRPVLTASPSAATICAAGGTVRVKVSGANNFTWSNQPGISFLTANRDSVALSPASSTTYTVTGTSGNCAGTLEIPVTVTPSPTITINPANPTICPGTSQILTASGGTTFSWVASNPGAIVGGTTGNSITVRPTGTTTLTVTGTSGGCTNTATVTVNLTSNSVVDAQPSEATICRNSPTGVVLRATGAQSYSWLPVAGLSATTGPTVTANPTQTTMYTVTGMNGNCSSVDSVRVSVVDAPALNVTPLTPTICLGGNGVVLTASGCSQYTWTPATGLDNPNSATPRANPQTTTTYVVTCVAGGCTSTRTVVVTVNTRPALTITPSAPIICNGNTATLRANGAATYRWRPASTILTDTTGETVIVRPTTTTTYTLTGSSAECSSTATVTVTVNNNVTITMTPAEQRICVGNTARITANAPRALSYTWSPTSADMTPSNGQGPTISVTPRRTTTYTVRGTDGVCETTASARVIVDTLPIIRVTPQNTILCRGGDGVALTATGGQTYSWAPARGLNATSGSVVTASPDTTITYTVTGISNGCFGTSTVRVTVSETALTVRANRRTASFCEGDSVRLTVSGAATYLWAPAEGLSQTTGTSVFAKPTQTTVYTVTGTGGNCTGADTITITVHPRPQLTATPEQSSFCQGDSTIIRVSGGIRYEWNPSVHFSQSNGSQVIAKPSQTTTYTITAISDQNCRSTTTLTLTVNPTPTTSVTPNRANLCDAGSVALDASGADTYTWLDQSVPSTIAFETGASNLVYPTQTTTYTVTGTRGDCSKTATVTVTVNTSPIIRVTPNNAILCRGSSTRVTAIGAQSYLWAPLNGSITPAAGNVGSVTLRPTTTTTYTVTGTSNGCTATATVVITVNPIPDVTVNPPSSTICSGDALTLTARGADEYRWTPVAGGIQGNGLGASVNIAPAVTTTYTVIGTTGTCSDTTTVTVTVNAKPVITFTPNTATICRGRPQQVTVSGCTSYSWAPNIGISPGTSAPTVTLNPPATQVYTVTCVNNNCQNTATITIQVIDPGPLEVNPANATICPGGSTTITAAGGTAYLWQPGNLTSASIVVRPTATTVYTVTDNVTTGCTRSATVTVVINTNQRLTVTPPVASICPGTTSATLTASNAQTYTWLPATGLNTTSGAVVVASPTTTTTYTVIGQGGVCPDTTKVTVNVGFDVQVSPSTPTVCAGGGCVGLKARGGANYVWQPSANLTVISADSVVVCPTATTTYTVSANQNNCSGSAAVTVTIGASTSASIGGLAGPYCTSAAPIVLTGSPAGGTFSGRGIVGNRFDPSIAGTGTHTITYRGTHNGCPYTTTRAVVVNQQPNPTITGLAPSYCLNSPPATLTGSPAGGSFSGPGIRNGIFYPSQAGIGTFLVVYSGTFGGCTYSRTATVTVGNNVAVSPENAVICAGGSGVTLTASGAQSYRWNPTNGLTPSNGLGSTVVANPSSTTVYTLTTTGGLCAGSRTVTVTVRSNLNITTTNVNASNASCNNGSITVQASGGTAPYEYSLRGGAFGTNNVFTGLSVGAYTISVRDVNGCTGVASVSITCTGGGSDVCATPTGLRVTPSRTTAVANWGSVNDARNYTLGFRRSNATTFTEVTITGTTYTITGLTPNTAYQARVRATCTGRSSAQSALVNFRTTSSRERISPELADVVVYPNPSQGQFNIRLNTTEASQAVVQLVDMAGKTVFFNTYTLIEGENSLPVVPETLPRGMYNVLIQVGNATQTVRMLVE